MRMVFAVKMIVLAAVLLGGLTSLGFWPSRIWAVNPEREIAWHLFPYPSQATKKASVGCRIGFDAAGVGLAYGFDLVGVAVEPEGVGAGELLVEKDWPVFTMKGLSVTPQPEA